ncbi:piggyBac transposable element-derived protein 3 [Dermacentor silvarum]|uniref:piggyBac transposable element-derived protein 3 n=1 Tax=Dermacentor silvarum TaxID=543639 RepID=UPI00189981F3|nr:piggyBac transposable element-derived protein 3 [Dermacentor silvarum]
MSFKRGLSREEIDALLDLSSSDSDDDSEAGDWEQLLTDLDTSTSSEEESDDSKPVRANGASTSSGARTPSRTSTARKDITAWIADKDNDYAGKPPDFLGEHRVNVHGALPIDYFLAVFPDSLLEHIVFQTNLYAVQKGKENLRLTLPELKVFLGMCLVMTYIKYPRIRNYWSTESGLRMDIVANSMPVNRFEELRRFLHFKDNSDTLSFQNDRVAGMRPVIDALNEAFCSAVDCEEYQSVDEMVIPFKGRSSIKQYLPSKPKRWGFKVWVRAGVSGYIYRFEVYQGATGGRSNVSSEFGMAGDVVIRLSQGLEGKNHKLYADNFFTSMALVRTCRANRLQGADKKLKPLKELKADGRGSTSICTSGDNITVTRWLDNSLVHVVSSYAGRQPEGTTRRYNRKERKVIDVTRPYSVEVYNKHMGGVDLMDSLIARYRNDVRNKRGYLRMFFHLLNAAVVNAWIVWRWDKGAEHYMDQLEFRSRVAKALIFRGEAAQSSKRRGRPSNDSSPALIKKRVLHHVPLEKRFDGGRHFPKKSEQKYASRCRSLACRSKTRYLCGRCNVPLCPECFQSFHSA